MGLPAEEDHIRIGSRYAAVQGRFLAGENIGSSKPEVSTPVPKNIYLKK